MEYLLRHKDDIAARIDFEEDSGALRSIIAMYDETFLPICAQNGHIENLKTWWLNRAVPRSRSDIRRLLDSSGTKTTQSLLLNNLGLSMTDAFWVCPSGRRVLWKDVSFHLNPPDSGLVEIGRGPGHSSLQAPFTPMASTGGELEKSWVMADGRVELVKGNLSGYYFQQSLNEVLATMVHEEQGHGGFGPYHLVRFRDGSVGCACPCFTDEHVELIPAWEVFAKHAGEPVRGSLLDAYAQYAERDGYDRDEVRRRLDYMFTVDFILSNTDRHSNNYGLLRNSDTLEPIGPAPIFDTGNSMFHLGGGIAGFHDLFHLPVSSLYPTDGEIMDRVNDPSLVDLSRLPGKDEVVSLLSKDPVVAPSAERLHGYMEFKAGIVKARQYGLPMAAIEKRLSRCLAEDERIDINKGWSRFWKELERSRTVKRDGMGGR